MKFAKRVMGVAAAVGMLTSSAAMAQSTTRAAGSLPVLTSPLKFGSGVRTSKKVAQSSSLLGAPLFIIFLGALVTIGTLIVVVDNGNDSPG
ncbi:MAG: hypothetical protein JWM38_2223 [Sphingomonas bacterium]|jgi:hypothetical protein|nr:hypothetical protein [Sphingomonas bacterium]MDB5682908.1 hypothetical protein [Sphingomonas bacterium]MDB5718796.1 hypothetical protein [Sphingomonas bacterium]